MEDSTNKKLRMMRFWLFGTFVILWAASLAYYFLYLAPISDVGTVVRAVWPVWAVAAVGAIAVYYIYRWWLGRQSGGMMKPPPSSGSPEM